MFNLIITIISIALVTVTAVVSVFYGGTVFASGQSKAVAADINSQLQQINTAWRLFEVDNGRAPTTLAELGDPYLKLDQADSYGTIKLKGSKLVFVLAPDPVTFEPKIQAGIENWLLNATVCNALAAANPAQPKQWTDAEIQAATPAVSQSVVLSAKPGGLAYCELISW